MENKTKIKTKSDDSNDANYISSRYFTILLENSIVSKADLQGNITFINENFIKTTGFSKKEAIGKNHNILRHPDVPSKIFRDMWNTIKSARVWRGRLLSRNKDGSDFWAEITIIPLVDKGTNKIIEYIGIRNDITEFLLMQRNLYRQKVQKREQKKITAAKDAFLILFTHELKTPLNAIINFTKYLLKHVSDGTINAIKPKKRQKLLEEIEQSASKMLIDVTQILELSKLKSNKLSYNISEFDVRDALKEAFKEQDTLCKKYGVTVKMDFKCQNCYIKSDFYRFNQILSNIISNAIKYSNGSINITQKYSDGLCIILVEDNGPGIKNKEKIFELFEQEDDNMATRESHGTGVGLHFVKYLCKDLNIDYKLEDSATLGGLMFILNCPATRLQ